jgi:hypothetical protein
VISVSHGYGFSLSVPVPVFTGISMVYQITKYHAHLGGVIVFGSVVACNVTYLAVLGHLFI